MRKLRRTRKTLMRRLIPREARMLLVDDDDHERIDHWPGDGEDGIDAGGDVTKSEMN